MKRLYFRIFYLSLGLMLYCSLLIGCYMYFFLAGGKNITTEFWWILIHEWLGHVVLYTTFYLYLRIKRHDHNLKENISGNKNIGQRLNVTRNRQIDKYLKYQHAAKTKMHSNPNVSKIINGGGSYDQNRKYYQCNDDFFADDDMSDFRKYSQIHRDSQSDQTEIMSLSANDEQQQQYNSYKNMAFGGMNGMLPPCNSVFSPNSPDNNHITNDNNTSIYDSTNYENFLI